MNATRESNESGRFSARLELAKLVPGPEIENVVFLGNTEILEERKHMPFLMQSALLGWFGGVDLAKALWH